MSSRQSPGLDRFHVQTYPCFTLGCHLVYNAEHVPPMSRFYSALGMLACVEPGHVTRLKKPKVTDSTNSDSVSASLDFLSFFVFASVSAS